MVFAGSRIGWTISKKEHQVQPQLGHATVTMTRHYQRADRERGVIKPPGPGKLAGPVCPQCPESDGWPQKRRPSRWAMCGRLRVGKSFLHACSSGSERPCVRPVSAVHVTAGHNVVRGSGPGQYHAFDHAVAQVGCPDRRIDRLCITCCLPSQPFTSRRMPGAISSRR
jgi:hypothetical protein